MVVRNSPLNFSENENFDREFQRHSLIEAVQQFQDPDYLPENIDHEQVIDYIEATTTWMLQRLYELPPTTMRFAYIELVAKAAREHLERYEQILRNGFYRD